MLISCNFPIVGDSTNVGDASLEANKAHVGAVLVANANGLWVLPISMIPDDAAGEVGSLVATVAKRLDPPGFLPQPEFILKSIVDGHAEIAFDSNHAWQINLAHGFKECSVNPRHTYPPKYKSQRCSPPCAGVLVSKP